MKQEINPKDTNRAIIRHKSMTFIPEVCYGIAHRFIAEMDKIEFKKKEGKVSSKQMDMAHDKWLAKLHHAVSKGGRHHPA